MFLLVNLPSSDDRKNIYPLGLAYIGASMEKYGVVTVIDLHYDCDGEKKLWKCLMSGSYLFIGMTVCTTHMHQAVRIAKMAKILAPKIIVAIGGPHATFCGKECLKQYNEIDFAFIGAGEIAADKVAQNIANQSDAFYANVSDIVYKKGSEILEAPYHGYDRNFILRPARHLLPSSIEYANRVNDYPTISIDTSRGCPGVCKFCTFSLDRTHRWMCRNIEDVKYDIVQTIKEECLETVDIFFIDADFLASTYRAKLLIQMVLDIPQIRKYIIAARSDSIIKAENILDDLFASGCATIELGIESAAQSQLDRYNKRTLVDTNYKALELLKKYQKKYKFAITADLIPFDPFVTSDELAQTNEFFQKYFRGDIQNEWSFIHEMMLAPGSLYREESIAVGLACEGNAADVSSWSFLNEDCANIFACLIYYRNMIYKSKTELRRKLNDYFEDLSMKKQEKIRFYKYYRWLNLVTYEIVDEAVSSKGKIDIIKRVEECKAKMAEIEEFMKNMVGAMV